MTPEVTDEIVKVVSGVVAALASWALLELRKFLATKTKETKNSIDDAVVYSATDILAGVIPVLAPELIKALADGKIDALESAKLVSFAEKLLGETQLGKLASALGTNIPGVRQWLAARLGLEALKVKPAEPEGLPPFFMSPEAAKALKK